jgi:hypothetical protein
MAKPMHHAMMQLVAQRVDTSPVTEQELSITQLRWFCDTCLLHKRISAVVCSGTIAFDVLKQHGAAASWRELLLWHGHLD